MAYDQSVTHVPRGSEASVGMSLETKARICRYAIIAAVIAAWEIVPQLGLVPRLFLPSLSSTLAMLMAHSGDFAVQMLVTLQEVGMALVFACGFGILFGLWVGSTLTVRKALLPVVSALFAVPLVVLYPLFTAWFGIGSASKVVFASVYGLLPTVLGTAAGAQTIDRQLTQAARSMGATRLQQILWVTLPASVPTVLASFRLGGALVIVGVVVAEMMMSSAGIGFLLSKYRTQLNSSGVFAAIILILALAIGFDLAVQAIERRWAGGVRNKAARRPADAP
ncbi:ABC transporter permease [Azospirillum sp. TSA2s]|nr:ABC transporter permease [Azospirillum sp. TSA2s]